MLPTRRTRLLRNISLTAAMLVFAAVIPPAIPYSAVYVPFSRALSGGLGAIFSYSVWPAAETLLCLLVAVLAATLIRAAVRSVRERAAWPLLLWGSGTLTVAAGICFFFMLLWGGCYYAPKLEMRLSLQTEPQSEEILLETARLHLSQVLLYADTVTRGEDGTVDAGGFEALAPEAVRSMYALSDALPGLISGGHISPPKRVWAYPILSYLGISGIYIPFTGESAVNPISTDPFLPSTMCHELAHRLSFAPEEDANLIAYLACMQSDTAIFRYSGSLMAFTYCYNALSSAESRAELWAQLPQTVIGDFARNSEAWRRYEGTLRKTAAAVNNAYLQSMGQSEGVKSYGRVVDMLIALHLREQSDQKMAAS